MGSSYWQKQIADKPLFPELLWSRPENKRTRGKLLIIGGNLHGFAAPAEAYNAATQAGIGTALVLLPGAVQKIVGRILENGEYAPSTPSGSFSQKALAELLEHSAWADNVLLAGDFGRNSETAICLEKFIQKYTGALTMAKDAVDYFKSNPGQLLKRPETTLVISMAQLQKLATASGFQTPFRSSMSLLQLVEALHQFTTAYTASIVVKQLDQIVVGSKGRISTSRLKADMETWRVKTAGATSVWWLQNPHKIFEALTSAVYEITNKA